MNGYKRILYTAERELEMYHEEMERATEAKDSVKLMRYTKHAMAMEDIIAYARIKLEVTK